MKRKWYFSAAKGFFLLKICLEKNIYIYTCVYIGIAYAYFIFESSNKKNKKKRFFKKCENYYALFIYYI